MNKYIDRITAIGLKAENTSFTVTSKQLLGAISEEVDLETVTDHELREIVFIVTKALNRMDWKTVVAHAIKHLPFGIIQTGIAWDGSYPCIGCPDAMMEDSSCYHVHECQAREIYESRY